MAHAALLCALVAPLRTFLRRCLRDDDEIERLVQDTLIAVHSRRASYDRTQPFTPCLLGIVRYKMLDHCRRVRRIWDVEKLGDLTSVECFEVSNASFTGSER